MPTLIDPRKFLEEARELSCGRPVEPRLAVLAVLVDIVGGNRCRRSNRRMQGNSGFWPSFGADAEAAKGGDGDNGFGGIGMGSGVSGFDSFAAWPSFFLRLDDRLMGDVGRGRLG